jgi:hypothetical protein
MDIIDVERLRAAAEREHQLNLEAIARVQRMQESLDGLVPPKGKQPLDSPPKKPAQSNGKKGTLMMAAKEAIAAIEGDFVRMDVEERVRAKHPRMAIKKSSMKSVLSNLIARGEIVLLEKAKGTSPARYSREKPEENEKSRSH